MAGASAGAEPTSPGGVPAASGEAASGAAETGAGPGAGEAPAVAANAPAGEASGARGEGRGRRGGGERANRRLVWKMGAKGLPEPAMVVVGISDGRNTEIVRGLSEGDTILTGIVGAQPAAGEQQGQGGGRGGGRGGRGRFL
jgi:hypothetical protein